MSTKYINIQIFINLDKENDEMFNFSIFKDGKVVVISSYSFPDAATAEEIVVSKLLDIQLLSDKHLLTLVEHENGEEYYHYLNQSLRSNLVEVTWDGIVVSGDRHYIWEDFIYKYPEFDREEITSVLPNRIQPPSVKPQIVWGVVGIKPDKDAWYYVKDAAVYVDKQLAKEQLKQAGKEFSVFGFEVK